MMNIMPYYPRGIPVAYGYMHRLLYERGCMKE